MHFMSVFTFFSCLCYLVAFVTLRSFRPPPSKIVVALHRGEMNVTDEEKNIYLRLHYKIEGRCARMNLCDELKSMAEV